MGSGFTDAVNKGIPWISVVSGVVPARGLAVSGTSRIARCGAAQAAGATVISSVTRMTRNSASIVESLTGRAHSSADRRLHQGRT